MDSWACFDQPNISQESKNMFKAVISKKNKNAFSVCSYKNNICFIEQFINNIRIIGNQCINKHWCMFCWIYVYSLLLSLWIGWWIRAPTSKPTGIHFMLLLSILNCNCITFITIMPNLASIRQNQTQSPKPSIWQAHRKVLT